MSGIPRTAWLRHPDRPLVIGHRGAPRAAAENSLEAFDAARTQGADWVELDVHLTSDGEVVVNHDPTYPDRRLIADTPVDDRPAGVCLFAEALNRCGELGLGVNVEIKAVPIDADHHTEEALTAATLGIISGACATDPEWRERLLITSFWPVTIDRVHAIAELATGWLTFDCSDPEDLARRVRDDGHAAVNPWDPLITPDVVDAAHEAGLVVNAWTVNEPARMEELASWGVDGLITDDPALARATLGF